MGMWRTKGDRRGDWDTDSFRDAEEDYRKATMPNMVAICILLGIAAVCYVFVAWARVAGGI